MVRRIIAGAAVVGALTLGVAGAVGAADAVGTTPSTAPSTTPASSTTTPTTTPCSDLAQIIRSYHSTQQKASKRARKADALESRLRKLGHSKLAGLYAKRVNRARTKEKHLEARLHQAVAACAGQGKGTASTSGTGSTSSGTGATSGTGSTSGTP